MTTLPFLNPARRAWSGRIPSSDAIRVKGYRSVGLASKTTRDF
jgi:hypothetical protein